MKQNKNNGKHARESRRTNYCIPRHECVMECSSDNRANKSRQEISPELASQRALKRQCAMATVLRMRINSST
jgi:ribosomal protein S24E